MGIASLADSFNYFSENSRSRRTLFTDDILRDVQSSLFHPKDEFIYCSVVHPEYVQALKINEG